MLSRTAIALLCLCTALLCFAQTTPAPTAPAKRKPARKSTEFIEELRKARSPEAVEEETRRMTAAFLEKSLKSVIR